MPDTTNREHPEELLPWYANGTLAGDERTRVDRHLADCAHCRAELEFLESVRQEVRSLDHAQDPGELVRARLLQQVRRSRPARNRWLPAALAASIAVIVLQAALLTWVWAPLDTFTPLGHVPSTDAVVQLRFAPEATERDIRVALEAVNGSIVDGPGTLGIYRVRLDAVRADDEARVAAAIRTLRESPGVVRAEREP